MTEPRRLVQEAGTSELDRLLLRSWENEQPSSQARAKALAIAGIAAAGAATALGAAGGSVAPKAAGIAGLTIAKWTAIGALALGTTAGAVAIATHQPSAPVRTPPASTQAAPPQAAPSPAAPLREEPKTAAPNDSPLVAPAPVPARASREPRASAAHTPTPSASALAEQTAALDHARSALLAGDPSRAVSLVDDYEARYPGGALTQEAEVVRIEALVKQGDRAGAKRAASRFLAQHPSSPHAARVRALVDTTP